MWKRAPILPTTRAKFVIKKVSGTRPRSSVQPLRLCRKEQRLVGSRELEGRKQGRGQGMEQGREQGKEQGREQGREQERDSSPKGSKRCKIGPGATDGLIPVL